jgi:hypothetical protein
MQLCLEILKERSNIAVVSNPVSPRNCLSSSSFYTASDSGDVNDKMQIHNLLSYAT